MERRGAIRAAVAAAVVLTVAPTIPLEAAPMADTSVVRKDFMDAAAGRAAVRKPLIAFALVSDVHQGDEELTLPSRTNWRDWAAVAPHMANAQVQAIDKIAAKGSPELELPISMLFSLGDAADNAQYNETRLFTDIFDGGKLVDPNSGGRAYDDKRELEKIAGGTLRSPVRGARILDLANEPFYAEGLHYPDGSPIPWYSVHGNHNTKVMGGIPHDDAAWRKTANAWAAGDLRIFNLNAQLAGELARIREKSPQDEPAFWIRTFKRAQHDPSVGDVRTVPADPRRRILSKQQWIDEMSKTTGIPKGHGFLPASKRCPDAYATPYDRRACFVVDHAQFRFIALDDTALEGYTTGSIDHAQFAWLEKELISSSPTYFDKNGKLVVNPTATQRYVVVLTHHTSKGIRNTGSIPGTGHELVADDLERLLLRFPNVILHASGHSHANRVWSHKGDHRGTGYWEISTASVIDHPHEGRTVEIADNRDGTLSIFSAPFTAVGADLSTIRWSDDPTDETKRGGARRIDERWLAAAGFKAASLHPAGYRYGDKKDRNVELPMQDPRAITVPVADRTSAFPVPVLVIGSLALGLLVILVRKQRSIGDPPSRPSSPPKRPASGPRPTGPKHGARKIPAHAGSPSRSSRPAA